MIRLLLIIHNRIILDLVRGSGGSVNEEFRADFSLSGREIISFLSVSKRVRSGDSDGNFS